jgi:hypothetical protein
MIDKLLRPFIPDQLKALCEKLEAEDFDARSMPRIRNVLEDIELTRFERFVVRRVYKRVRRMHDMNRVMEELIIGQQEYNINTDINEKLRNAVQNGLSGTALWNGVVPQPEQSKRVIVRPKARA